MVGDFVLAELDAVRTCGLPEHLREELANAVVAQVGRQLRRVAHIRPFASVDAALSQLDIGTRTSEVLASIPDGFLSEVDVGSLLELPDFDVKGLLDLLSALDVRSPGASSRRDRATFRETSAPGAHTAPAKPSDLRRRTKNHLDVGSGRAASVSALPWRASQRSDSLSLVNDRGTFSLDMLTGVDAEIGGHPRSILRFWGDITADDLPPPARTVALGPEPTPDGILRALLSEESIEFGHRALLDDFRATTQSWDATRRLELSLRRQGLLSDEIPTLQQIGDELDLTRERVRQLLPSEEGLLEGVAANAALVLSVGAWFALNPRMPMTTAALEEMTSSAATLRALRMVLRAMHYPHIHSGGDFWVSTDVERRAVDALLDYLSASEVEGSTWDALEADVAEALPGIDTVLDLSRTLRAVTWTLDIGIGPRGDLVRGVTRESRSLARKIATFLRARAVPIKPVDLAAVMTAGYWPFERMRGSAGDPQWLEDWARRQPALLRVLGDGAIALPEGASTEPTGHVGVLYRIVLENRGPMRTQELCRRAEDFGIDSNQVGMLIHSRRAACLLALARGLVGLVGRDEEEDPEDHSARPQRPAATPADSPDCFLFEDGWGVRLAVDHDLLASGRWQIPNPLAEVLGFRGGAVRRIPPRHSPGDSLAIDGKVWKTHASSLSGPLGRVSAVEGDLAFVLLGPNEYDVVLRRARELDGEPLTSLMWSCGLDPHDPENRADPWPRLARALGGAGSTRGDVAARLRQRRQTDLLALLEEATRAVTRSGNGAWPSRWFYRLRLVDDSSVYAVVGPSGHVRTAVGVVPEGTHVPVGLFVTDGGLVWTEGFASGALRADLPPEIAPAATSVLWVRWARAEHGARLAALAGERWWIRVDGGSWYVGAERFASLLEALEFVGSDRDAEKVPEAGSGRPYPRSALAFERAASAAASRGLTEIRADAEECFVASFGAGVKDKGLTLLDAIDGRRGT